MLIAQGTGIVGTGDDCCYYYGVATGMEIVVNDPDAAMANAAVVVD